MLMLMLMRATADLTPFSNSPPPPLTPRPSYIPLQHQRAPNIVWWRPPKQPVCGLCGKSVV